MKVAEPADVILIQPRYAPGVSPYCVPPWGLLSIGAHLERQGFDVGLVDYQIHDSWDLMRCLSEVEPTFVGISVMSGYVGQVVRLAVAVRKMSPASRVVVGGKHFTIAGAYDIDWADHVVVGPGELAFELIASGADASRVMVGGEMPLQDIPLPGEELLRHYAGHGNGEWGLMVSRGCPFSCGFCSGDRRSVVRYGPSRVAQLVEAVIRRGADRVFFMDDIFTLSREWLAAVCEVLPDAPYRCFTHASVHDPGLYSMMREAGFYEVQLGVESGDQRLLDRMDKRTTPDGVREAVDAILAGGLAPTCLFMLGYVGDTEESMRTTIEFARELKGRGAKVWFSAAQPFPNTRFREEALLEGCIIGRDADFDNKSITYLPAGVSLEQMTELMEEARTLH